MGSRYQGAKGSTARMSDIRSKRYREWRNAHAAPREADRLQTPNRLTAGVARYCTGSSRLDLAQPHNFSAQETQRFQRPKPGPIDIRKSDVVPKVQKWLVEQEEVLAGKHECCMTEKLDRKSYHRQPRTLVLREVWMVADGCEGERVMVNYDSHQLGLQLGQQWRCQDYLQILDDGTMFHETGTWSSPCAPIGAPCGKAGVLIEKSKSGWAGWVDPGVKERQVIPAHSFPAPDSHPGKWKMIFQNLEPTRVPQRFPADIVGNALDCHGMMWVEHLETMGFDRDNLQWRNAKPYPGTYIRGR